MIGKMNVLGHISQYEAQFSVTFLHTMV